MALKDLLSNLENFKYGMSSPDRVDNQIEKGVDFFPNDDAQGFTPKTDLESLYNSVKPPYAKEWPAAAPENFKTRSGYGTFGEYDIDEVTGRAIPQFIFNSDTILGIKEQPQFTSDFMTTPLADYTSRFFPPENDSLTFSVQQHTSTGPEQFTIKPFDNTPQLEGAHGGNLLPNADNQFDFTAFRTRARSTEPAPFHSSIAAPFSNDGPPSPFLRGKYDVVFGKNAAGKNVRDRYKDGSVHILGTDLKSPIGGDVTEFATLTPLAARQSVFSSDETPFQVGIYQTPTGLPSQVTLNLPREAHRKTDTEVNDVFVDSFHNPAVIRSKYEDSDYISDLFKFGSATSGNTFKNVPSGINENNLQGTKDYRAVADPFNYTGFAQPFILREIPEDDGNRAPGNGRWGLDASNSETGFLGQLAAGIDGFLGGFVRGAPTFTGLVERNFADKFRIAKFLLTPQGIGFIGKQYVLQALNPTIETKLYNPLSILGLPLGSITDPSSLSDAGSLTDISTLLAGFALPISHVDRHVGGLKYEKINPISKLDGDKEPGKTISSIPAIGSAILDAVNDKIEDIKVSRLGMQAITSIDLGIAGKQEFKLKDKLLLINPNKYLVPASSAPISIEDGIPSFFGGRAVAEKDADKVTNKYKPGQTQGGVTFNKQISKKTSGELNTHYYTSTYAELTRAERYVADGFDSVKMPKQSPIREVTTTQFNTSDKMKVTRDVGVGAIGNTPMLSDEELEKSKNLAGQIGAKAIIVDRTQTTGNGALTGDTTDKVNLLPYGTKDFVINGQPVKDYIKFRFHDLVNNKFLVFRAILEGISDSITADYGEERYIGRPDKVYVYQGADRNVSFTFKIYPKTVQELPVVMEKLNYLVGLCYPSYTPEERMITPLISLTMGDMFDRATGLLQSITVNVEDASTWEIEEGLQFPHFITVACEFKYIGNSALASKGKHYGLNWLPDGNGDANRFTNTKSLGFNNFPNREQKRKVGDNEVTTDFRKFFEALGQVEGA